MMKRSMVMLSAATAVVLMTGCAWVKPTPGGSRVSVVTNDQANYCEKIGQTKANTQKSVGFLDRNASKISEELITLARNSAYEMGGNAIIPITQVVDGKQTFAVLRCSNLP